MRLAILGILVVPVLYGQWWTAGEQLKGFVEKQTDGKVSISGEFRVRFEDREGVTFGKDVDRSTALLRSRFGMVYRPVSWLKIGGMVQDARAPLYGTNAPNSARNMVDLQEAYVEINSNAKRGFGFSGGRMMMNYGDGRLIGTPQWGNAGRTYDEGRAWWRAGKVQVEFLALSIVKVDLKGFDKPILGDRLWGTYNTLPEFIKGHKVEAYYLRRDQNRPGGYTGSGTIGVNTFGSRWAGPLAHGWKYVVEGAAQTGHTGLATQRSGAFVSTFSHKYGKFDVLGEYKYASGSDNPQDKTRNNTFDQLYGANHDRFSHQDLFGWRNIHNVKAMATYAVNKKVTLNTMYGNFWLASAKDSLYNGSGKAIVASAAGTAGRHVGDDVDFFGTYKPVKGVQFGAGAGFFRKGEFIEKTTPGVSPLYFYVFQSYTF